MEIYDIRINGYENPLGYDIEKPRVSWKVKSGKGSKQDYTIIEVSKKNEFSEILYKKEGELNSLSEELEFELSPYTRYYVRITVCSNVKEVEVSNTVFFETAKMKEAWQAYWIGTQENDDFHPVFSKIFPVKNHVKQARLYVTGLGLFEAYVNGVKAGDDFLAPFISDYAEEVQYCTYDVTNQLNDRSRDRENKIEIYLGNGWYKGRFGFFPMDPLKRFACIAEVHCVYKDDTVEIIGTDETWTYCGSKWDFTDIYDGEIHNSLLWDNRDNPMKNAKKISFDSVLTARHSLPLHVMESISVKKVIYTPAGETVLDFGQNFAGYVECIGPLIRGQKITMEFGEILQDGNFYHENYRTAKSVFSYISDGEETCIYPHFTFFGFRYVKLIGFETVYPNDFQGKVVYSEMKQTGRIYTSNDKINRLVDNTIWGLKSNFLEMPTDCPQRDERLGWTGDAQVFCRTAGYHMDTRAFYQKFLRDLRMDQKKNDGKVAVYLPNTAKGMTSCVWSDIGTFLPEMLYEYYGDIEALKENYPIMKDWVDSVTREDEKRGEKNLWDFGFQFGDWLALDGATDQSTSGGTDKYYVSSVYYYASTTYVAEAAKLLELKEENKYRILAEKIRKAILDEFYTVNGRLAIDTQTGYLLALKFGLYMDKERIVSGLQERLKKDCYRIKGGFVGATMMNTVLAEHGMEKLAYDFLLFEGFPGWLYQVNLGATTIWERWNSVLPDGKISGTGMNSLNHYSYGAVAEFLYRHAAGIIPVAPGFKKVRFEPKPDGRFQFFRCSYDSASGTFVSNWEVKEDGNLHFYFEVPFGTEAVIVLPDYEGEAISVTSGVYEYTYTPIKDYRILFDENTRMEFLVENPKARAILEKYIPDMLNTFSSDNIEVKASSILDMKRRAMILQTPAEHLDRILEELALIRSQ